jgi:7-keto-8-aminopelargonate synthetase-like enzyme
LNIVRISLSAAHSDEDIGRMIEVLGALAKQIKPIAA